MILSLDKSQAQVELVQSESVRLKQYVNALPLEALESPSPCERWNVGEVIAHLVWFAETYGGMMERGLRGDLSPTEGFPAVPGTLSGPAIEELYAQGAIDRRRSLGQDLLVVFNERYDGLNDLLAQIGPEDWEKPCYHTLRIRPVHSFLPTIIQELAVHDWDIRSALEPFSPSVGGEPTRVDGEASKQSAALDYSFWTCIHITRAYMLSLRVEGYGRQARHHRRRR